MNEIANDATNMNIFREWLAGMGRRRKRVLLVALTLFGGVWLSGAMLASATVAGIERLSPGLRAAAALCFGGFTWLWMLLERNGDIVESVQRSNALWIPLAGVLPAIIGFFILRLSRKVDPATQMKRRMKALDRSQGHVSAEHLAETCVVERGIPLAYVRVKKGKKARVGLQMDAESHIFSIAPTGRGKSLHLTDVLLSYRGAALVVDPKGEMLERTAGMRSAWGPIYRFPGHELCLADYYDRLLDRDSAAELHYHLLRPWQDRERVFAEKSLSLFTALALFAEAMGLDPVRVLLDLAESDPVQALAALERVRAARRHVRVFTNGAPPDRFQDDRFATSAFGTFTTRLAPYQKHVNTIAPPQGGSGYDWRRLDPDWIQQRGTIYLTYDLPSMKGAGGIIAAIIAGIVRQHLRQHARRGPGSKPGARDRMLIAVDELAHVGLGNLDTYLSTVRSAGIMFLLYVQSLEQLDDVYGRNGTEKIVGNCDHQLWYAPNTPRTGERLSELYGRTFRPMPTHSASEEMRSYRDREGRATTQTSAQQGASTVWREVPHLTATQFMALPRDQVLVRLMAGRGASRRPGGAPSGGAEDAGVPYIFIGERLNSIHLFDRLPGPEPLHLPEPRSGERVYTDWTAAGPEQQAETPAGPAAAEEGAASVDATGERTADGEAEPARGDDGKKERGAGEGIADAASTEEPDEPEVGGMF